MSFTPFAFLTISEIINNYKDKVIKQFNLNIKKIINLINYFFLSFNFKYYFYY